MLNENIKNFYVFIMQRNYKLLTNFITNLQNHGNSLYEYNIISLYERNIFL